MNRFIKKAVSGLCSTLVAVLTISPAFGSNIAKVTAYSNSQKFVDTAMELDYISGRTNEATLHYGITNCDWCAMFVHLSAYRCGLGDKIPKLAYCDNQYFTDNGNQIEGYRSYYEKRGQFLYRTSGQFPKVGDLVVFETSSIPDGKADHIGIVTGIDADAGYIYTIEGNGGGDIVRYKSYPYTSSAIIGYCQTMLDDYSYSTENAAPAPSVDVNTNFKQWQVTSPIGCNLRFTPNGNSLGILSTGTILNCEPSKNQGEWIFVKSATTETGTILDGYVHISTIIAKKEQTSATTPTTLHNSLSTATHYISSLIGANGRTNPEFNNNIAKIIDTDTELIVNYYQNDFANCTIANTGERYFIHASTISSLNNISYTECARANYYISSDCGVNLRRSGDYNGEVICILDTYQKISVLTEPNEFGFVFVECTLNNKIYNGYVHRDYIEKIN